MPHHLRLLPALVLTALLTSCGEQPTVAFDDLGWKDDRYTIGDKPFSGVAIQKHSDGSTKARWELKDGAPHGVVTEFTPEGIQIVETHFTDGIRDGTNTYWDEQGTLIKIQVYDMGSEVSVEYFGSLAEKKSETSK